MPYCTGFWESIDRRYGVPATGTSRAPLPRAVAPNVLGYLWSPSERGIGAVDEALPTAADCHYRAPGLCRMRVVVQERGLSDRPPSGTAGSVGELLGYRSASATSDPLAHWTLSLRQMNPFVATLRTR